MRRLWIRPCSLIKVKYEVLEPVLDYARRPKDNQILVHPEDELEGYSAPVGADNKQQPLRLSVKAARGMWRRFCRTATS